MEKDARRLATAVYNDRVSTNAYKIKTTANSSPSKAAVFQDLPAQRLSVASVEAYHARESAVELDHH